MAIHVMSAMSSFRCFSGGCMVLWWSVDMLFYSPPGAPRLEPSGPLENTRASDARHIV